MRGRINVDTAIAVPIPNITGSTVHPNDNAVMLNVRPKSPTFRSVIFDVLAQRGEFGTGRYLVEEIRVSSALSQR